MYKILFYYIMLMVNEKGFVMKKSRAEIYAEMNSKVDMLVGPDDDIVAFINLANDIFSKSCDNIEFDMKHVDLYIKNCVFIRGLLEKHLGEVIKNKNKVEEVRILTALEKNRLNYSHFVMLKRAEKRNR